MKILFAAATLQLSQGLLDTACDILEAYPTLAKGHALLEYLKVPRSDRIAMLDSGAFSAWSKGRQVPFDSYIQFCKDYDTLFTCFVNVDVIPGKWGEIPNAQQVEESARKGWDNFQYMLDKGIPPEKVVHVFHQNEEFKWLQKLVEFDEAMRKERSNWPGLYIGISPANDRTTKQKIMWLDQCMPYVTNPDGSAKIKWHGFGVTSFEIMGRYPWYTCDSTSWMRAPTFGAIIVPHNVESYLDGSITVGVTSDCAVSQGDHHIESFSTEQRASVEKYLATMNLTIADVATSAKARATVGLLFYKRIVEEINKKAPILWRKPQQSFF